MKLINNIDEIRRCFPNHVSTDRLTSDILRSIKDGHTYLELFCAENEKNKFFYIDVLERNDENEEGKQIEMLVSDFDSVFYTDYTEQEFDDAMQSNAEYINYLLKLPTFLKMQLLRLLDYRYTYIDCDLRELCDIANVFDELIHCVNKRRIVLKGSNYDNMYDAITHYQQLSGITYGFDFRKKCYDSMNDSYARDIDYCEEYRDAYSELSAALSDAEEAITEFELSFVELVKCAIADAYTRSQRLVDSTALSATERLRVMNFVKNLQIAITDVTKMKNYSRSVFFKISKQVVSMFYVLAHFEQRYIDAYFKNKVNIIV